jgi:hypothetical protein
VQAAFLRVSDEDGDSHRCRLAGGEGIEFAIAGGTEVVAQQQILGRITAERQFRRQQQVGTLLPGALGKIEDPRFRLPAKSPTVALIWAIAIFRDMGSGTSEKGRSTRPPISVTAPKKESFRRPAFPWLPRTP